VKAARFLYRAPTTLDEALTELAADDEAKILAGGQSLVPAMNFRLARPSVLVDINRVSELQGITVGSVLRIGSLTRHRSLETPPAPGATGDLMATAAHHIGHLPIRVRGTFGGSLAHADPASEWCVVALTLDATMEVASPRGRRSVPARDWFQTVFTTALGPDEILTAVEIPLLTPHEKVGFAEFSRRAGDFALTIATVVLTVEAGAITQAKVGLGGVAATPVRSAAAEQIAVGLDAAPASAAIIAEAAAEAIDPLPDIHASSEYRRDLVRAMVGRAITRALP
jgi:carbon-monoxide dehydrogenase medium subunit